MNKLELIMFAGFVGLPMLEEAVFFTIKWRYKRKQNKVILG